MKMNEILGGEAINGFHDANIEQLSLDYEAQEAVLTCSIWIGDLGSTDEEVREAYRKGRLTFQGLKYCVIEPPDPKSFYEEEGGIRVSGDSPVCDEPTVRERLPSDLPVEAFAHYFYVADWNSFIYIAAEEAHFEWID